VVSEYKGDQNTHHVHFNDDLVEVIQEEAPSESDTTRRINPPVQADPYDMYKRIDQEELEKLELAHKSNVQEEKLGELHQFTLLQRFRHGKDLKAEDKFKSKKPVHPDNKENQEQNA